MIRRVSLNLIAACLSILCSLILISPVLATYINQPPNTHNMMVGVYFADYYEYLAFIKDGQQGNILTHNLFTTDDMGQFFVPWWPYSIMGFVLRFLSPQSIFWGAIFVLNSIQCYALFIVTRMVMDKEKPLTILSAFLLVLFSSGFYKISLTDTLHIEPFTFWYSNGSPFYRYGLPHHQIAAIILLFTIVFLLYRLKKKGLLITTGGITISSLLLLISSPPYLLLFWSSAILALLAQLIVDTLKRKRSWKKTFTSASIILLPFIISSIVIIPAALVINAISAGSPTHMSARIWDINNYYYPPLWLFILSTGPLCIFGIFGIWKYFSSLHVGRLLLGFLTLLSILLILHPFMFMSKNLLTLIGVHNLRFNTSVFYLFPAIATILLFKSIVKKTIYVYICTLLMLLFFIPPLYEIWKQTANGPKTVGIFQYMPNEMFAGLHRLEDSTNTSAVMTSPGPGWGLLVPAISGRRVYLGRPIFTLDFVKKQTNAAKFYALGFSANDAITLLRKEQIGDVVLYAYDANRTAFENHYPFLTSYFTNSYMTLYKIR